ncbi:hypothetical protein D5S18_18745 [Nocardia panacis]|uniref:Uncharacterized protein n=1 Tax=Nocardia panacis TaxID=2340916 RepID=A0A3A4JVF3_9NOCA|nr:hypothetical protein [Nocardia panacis]RJO74193.1 hypothetical protein D5S18_18745 [Nocardia panacis]
MNDSPFGERRHSHTAPAAGSRRMFDGEIEVWLSGHWHCTEKSGGTTESECGMRWWLLEQRAERGLDFRIPTREQPPGWSAPARPGQVLGAGGGGDARAF